MLGLKLNHVSKRRPRGLLGVLYHVSYVDIVLEIPVIVFKTTCCWTKYLVKMFSLKGCVKTFRPTALKAPDYPLFRHCWRGVGCLKPYLKYLIKQTAVALPRLTLNLTLSVGSGDIVIDCLLDDWCIRGSVFFTMLYPGLFSFCIMGNGMNKRVKIGNLICLSPYNGLDSSILFRAALFTLVYNKALCPPLEQ